MRFVYVCVMASSSVFAEDGIHVFGCRVAAFGLVLKKTPHGSN